MITFGLSAILKSKAAGAADGLLKQAQSIVSQWYESKAGRPDAAGREFNRSEQTYTSDSGALVWEFLLRQKSDEGSRWSTEVRLYMANLDAPEAELSVVMRIDSASEQIAPVRFFADPPKFLRDLQDHFEFSIGNSVATRSIVPIGESQVKSLIEFLASPDRSLPAILVTEPDSGSAPIAGLAGRLGEGLVGLAAVLHLDRPAASTFAETVGNQMAVFNGGVRLYWPRWKATDAPRLHPLFIARRIALLATHDSARPEALLRTALLSLLSRAAVARFSYPKLMRSLIDAHQELQLRRQLGDKSSDELISAINDLHERLAETSARVDDTEYQLLEAQDQITNLQENVDRLRGRLKAAGVSEHDPWDVTSTDEALDLARTDFAGTLVIPSNLRLGTSLAPGMWYHVFKALSRLCELERRGEAKDKFNQLRDLIQREAYIPNATYKVGETGLKVTGPGGNKVSVKERVHLKDGSPSETASVYWLTTGSTQKEYRYEIVRAQEHY